MVHPLRSRDDSIICQWPIRFDPEVNLMSNQQGFLGSVDLFECLHVKLTCRVFISILHISCCLQRILRQLQRNDWRTWWDLGSCASMSCSRTMSITLRYLTSTLFVSALIEAPDGDQQLLCSCGFVVPREIYQSTNSRNLSVCNHDKILLFSFYFTKEAAFLCSNLSKLKVKSKSK